MYANSFFHLPFTTFQKDRFTPGANNNGFENLNLKDTYIQMVPFFGQCAGMYPWATARFSYALALADPQALKEEIIKYLALDWQKHRAYDNILGNHRGDNVEYAFNYWSMSKLIYDYVTSTSDFAFLNEVHSGFYGQRTILSYLEEITDLPEKIHNTQDQLVDFGNDYNLWEYNIHCDLGNRLVHYVFSPNAERYNQNKMLANLYQQRGNYFESEKRNQKANSIKEAIFSRLWDPQVGTFNSNFPVPMVLHTLDFEGFWQNKENEKNALINFAFTNPATNFIGTHGFTSLPTSWDQNCFLTPNPTPTGSSCQTPNHWCKREDWHGPGLYTGEVMHILKGLFKEGQKEKAMEMLNKYSYLANAPFWGEALPFNKPSFNQSGYAAISYMDGGFGFSEVIIQGLFGVQTDSYITTIFPRIPANFGETSLTDLNVQSHKFDIHINQNNTIHTVDMCVGCRRTADGPPVDHTRIRYGTEGRKKVIFTFRNLENGFYTIKQDNQIIGFQRVQNNILNFTVNNWEGVHNLFILSGGDANQDGFVNEEDFQIWLEGFRSASQLKNADFNNDGRVDGIDYEYWRRQQE